MPRAVRSGSADAWPSLIVRGTACRRCPLRGRLHLSGGSHQDAARSSKVVGSIVSLVAAAAGYLGPEFYVILVDPPAAGTTDGSFDALVRGPHKQAPS
jgi:hypothetical protein